MQIRKEFWAENWTINNADENKLLAMMMGYWQRSPRTSRIKKKDKR